MLIELMLKDLEQNAKPLALFLAAVGVSASLYALSNGGDGGEAYLGFVTAVIVFGGGLVLPMLFIGDENAKGTFRFLSILPIGPIMIACAKFMLIIGLMVVVILTSMAIIPWVLVQSGLAVSFVSVVTMLWLVVAGLLSTAIGASLFFALSYKLASQVAYGALALSLAAFVWVMSALEERGAVSTVEVIFSRVSVAIGSLMLSVIIVILAILFSANTMKWKDWSDLGVER